MAKKISTTQRLVTMAMEASPEELIVMIDTLKAVQDSKFPATKKRAPRKDKGTTRTTKGDDTTSE